MPWTVGLDRTCKRYIRIAPSGGLVHSSARADRRRAKLTDGRVAPSVCGTTSAEGRRCMRRVDREWDLSRGGCCSGRGR
ncbi:hypothetical protein AG1IA_00850 [Rhizoctonia solani AG-1 IA]|uniref:Uncharacterized protein n=1 Tax=Thanatephorus cucumeris (strain AG1-IA) TaxID=983506 RepID=L8X483_THACA|nr:hypothetical protein AG1IA_00850 [Rhizoctonia solani AG-1 IA]